MSTLRIYLDTSVINFLFAEDAPENRQATEEFFENYVRLNVYDVYVSSVVVDEILRTPDTRKRTGLLQAIDVYNIDVIDYTSVEEEVLDLAASYVEAGIIPRKEDADALHVAIATVFEMDVLLSWNYRHLANVNKEVLIQSANAKAGYVKPLRMCTPLEALNEEG